MQTLCKHYVNTMHVRITAKGGLAKSYFECRKSEKEVSFC